MAATHGPSVALDALERSLNDIFLNIGSVFNSTVVKSSRNDIRSSDRVKSSIPNAVTRFHDALDELETELVQAKVVLLRDLTQLRLKESAALTESQQAQTGAALEQQPENDVEMVDKDDAPEVKKETIPQTEESPKDEEDANASDKVINGTSAPQNALQINFAEEGKKETQDEKQKVEEAPMLSTNTASNGGDQEAKKPGDAATTVDENEEQTEGMDLFGQHEDGAFDELFNYDTFGEGGDGQGNFDASEFGEDFFNV